LTADQIRQAGVRLAEVQLRPMGQEIPLSGRMAFSDLHSSKVLPPVAGRVIAIHAAPGQSVKQGQPLVTVLAPEVGGFAADLARARADLRATQLDYERERDLIATQATSQREYQQALYTYQKAQADLARAEERTRLFRRGSRVAQSYVVRSPIDGEVVARNVNPGMELQGQYSSGGAVPEMFVIGLRDPLWVLLDVFEQDLGRVQVGAPLTVRSYADQQVEHRGTVEWISGALDPATRTARIRATLANPDGRLKPEMLVSARVSTPPRPQLALAEKAVVRLRGETVVFVDAGRSPDGRIRLGRRVVEVAEDAAEDGYMPVLRGVGRGQRVVVSGGLLLSTQAQ
jgi:cobalt-zinc-cadmium efflux system membrane fusion protein